MTLVQQFDITALKTIYSKECFQKSSVCNITYLEIEI